MSEYALENTCAPGFVIYGDVRELPFKDGFFDVVHSQGLFGYQQESDVKRAVAECHRIGRIQDHNVDSSEAEWHNEYRYITWQSRAWWDEHLKGPQILIACANYSCKEYAMQRWLDAVDNLDWPNKRMLLVDNSDTPEFYERWCERVSMIRIELQREPMNRRIALSMERIRQEFLASDATYWLNLESDVIAPPETIRVLLKHGQQACWTSHNYPDRTNPEQGMSGFGCSLFSRLLMEQTSFAQAPAETTCDGWYWRNEVQPRRLPVVELWGMLKIEHLNN